METLILYLLLPIAAVGLIAAISTFFPAMLIRALADVIGAGARRD